MPFYAEPPVFAGLIVDSGLEAEVEVLVYLLALQRVGRVGIYVILIPRGAEGEYRAEPKNDAAVPREVKVILCHDRNVEIRAVIIARAFVGIAGVELGTIGNTGHYRPVPVDVVVQPVTDVEGIRAVLVGETVHPAEIDVKVMLSVLFLCIGKGEHCET